MNNTELKSLRTRLGLTQATLAQAVGVVPNTLARWERDELDIPDWAIVFASLNWPISLI